MLTFYNKGGVCFNGQIFILKDLKRNTNFFRDHHMENNCSKLAGISYGLRK